MKRRASDFNNFLKSAKLRRTRTRQWIYDEIAARPDVHPNAYDIFERLKAKRRDVSLATVYRTLRLLVKSGLVSQIDLGEDHSHYEPEGSKSGHGHLICLSCGKVTEFSDAAIQDIIGRVGRSHAFALDKFSIQVFGYCESCKRK
jgi:Fur family ferric uptake transcriptional regulator